MPHVPDFLIKLPKVPNLTELAYLSLKQHMLDGSLVEGSRLTEETLARQLGISKSPVREALNRLEAEGLITIEARRGAFVRKFTLDETRDLFDLRILLEVYAVERAQITPDLLTALADSIERTKEHLRNGDKLAHSEEDLRFHTMIAASTGNGEFVRAFDSVQHKSILSRSKTYHLSPTSAPVNHQKIYEALKKGDREEAKRAMRDHIQFLGDSLLDFIRAHGEGTMPHDEEIALASVDQLA